MKEGAYPCQSCESFFPTAEWCRRPRLLRDGISAFFCMSWPWPLRSGTACATGRSDRRGGFSGTDAMRDGGARYSQITRPPLGSMQCKLCFVKCAWGGGVRFLAPTRASPLNPSSKLRRSDIPSHGFQRSSFPFSNPIPRSSTGTDCSRRDIVPAGRSGRSGDWR